MLFENMWQRIALDTDRMMIMQCGNDYHDYSNYKLACIYVKWAEERIVLNVYSRKLTRAESTFTFTNVSPSANRRNGKYRTKCVIPTLSTNLR